MDKSLGYMLNPKYKLTPTALPPLHPFLAGMGEEFVGAFDDAWKQAWRNHETVGHRHALITMCSHAKPYSKSFIHTGIRKALQEAGDLLRGVTYAHASICGLVPSSCEMDYPFNAYDGGDGSLWEPRNQQLSIDALAERTAYWVDNFSDNFKGVTVYLRNSGHTIRGVQRGLERYRGRVTVVQVNELVPPLPYVLHPDTDDCLVHPSNLLALTNAMKGATNV